jgi:hypothetical protein
MALSAAMHAAVIGLAVAATGQGSVLLDDPTPDRVTWVKPPTPPERAPRADAPCAHRAGSRPQPGARRPAGTDHPRRLVGGHRRHPARGPLARRDRRGRAAPPRARRARAACRAAPAEGGGSPDTPFALHRGRAAGGRAPGQRLAALPELLRSAGVGGRVLAQFVVDTAGRVEPGSLRVLSTSHPQFTAAVEAALPRMRFLPAEAAGRRCGSWWSSRSSSRCGRAGREAGGTAETGSGVAVPVPRAASRSSSLPSTSPLSRSASASTRSRSRARASRARSSTSSPPARSPARRARARCRRR